MMVLSRAVMVAIEGDLASQRVRSMVDPESVVDLVGGGHGHLTGKQGHQRHAERGEDHPQSLGSQVEHGKRSRKWVSTVCGGTWQAPAVRPP